MTVARRPSRGRSDARPSSPQPIFVSTARRRLPAARRSATIAAAALLAAAGGLLVHPLAAAALLALGAGVGARARRR
jgi:hypothetical protein